MKTATRGFTLVESLIGVVLLSLGMLGAWAMLLTGLRSYGDARYRAAATGLLHDMAERIRANPAARMLYDTRTESAEAVQCTAAACDPAQLASSDLAYFAAAANALFPAMDLLASIEFEPAIGPATNDRYTLVLTWRGPRDPEPGNTVTLHLLAQPVAG